MATIQGVYVALFGRPADPTGLAYYKGITNDGKDLSKIGDLAQSKEYQDRFAGQSNAQIVNSLYLSLFGHDADVAGLNFFVSRLNSKEFSINDIAIRILDAAQGTDKTTADLKVAAADKFTAQLDTTQEIVNYSGTAAADSGRAFLATVTTTAPTDAQVTAAVAVATSTPPNNGSSFTLTANSDNLSPNSVTATTKTTAANDTIYANDAGSLGSGDVIDAGGGVDTIFSIQTLTTAATLTPVLSNVEKVFIDVNDGTIGTAATFTFSGGSSTGLQEVWANAVSGSTNGFEDTFAITNVTTAVTTGIKKGDGEYNVTTTYTGVDGTADVANLALSEASVDTVTINGVETLKISNADGNSTIAALAADKLKALEVSGTKNLTVTGEIGFDGTAGTVNAANFSGDLDLKFAASNDKITFTGGSGKNTITTGTGDDVLTGGAKDDSFTVGTGKDTVTGGAGNDRVVFADIADWTSDDAIQLGEGTRDTAAYGTITAVNNTNFTAARDALITAAGAEVVELTAANVSAVDFSAVPVDIVRLSNTGNAQVALSNVSTNDTIIFTADRTGGAAEATVAAAGSLPGQTLRVELFGTDTDIVGNAAASANNNGLALTSNITTLQIDSTATTASTLSANSISSGNAAAAAIANTATQSVVITGNQALEIVGAGAAVGFTAGVAVDASAFTANLTIELSDANDTIKGGTKNDLITAGNGDDSIDLTAGGTDKLVFGTHAANGKDTVTGFTGGVNGDQINVAALGDGTTVVLTGTISSAAAQQALVDDSAYIINTTGAAGNLTTGGTKAVTDFTNLTQVAEYLSERFTTAANNDEAVFVVNSGANSYVYSYDDAGTNGIGAGELVLVGVFNGATLTSDNVLFA